MKIKRSNLKKERIKNKLTQQELSDRLHISLRYYQQLESGERTGTFEIWDMLEDITGVHQRILRCLCRDTTTHP